MGWSVSEQAKIGGWRVMYQMFADTPAVSWDDAVLPTKEDAVARARKLAFAIMGRFYVEPVAAAAAAAGAEVRDG
jgi:hypothetical protein